MYEHVEPQFAELLGRYTPADLESHQGSILGAWADGRIGYVNPAWFRFAAENDGSPAIERSWSLGADWLASVPIALRMFYSELLSQALNQPPDARQPVQHTYECSSPEMFRKFRMTLHTLGEGRGVLAVHALLVEHPHDPSQRIARIAAEDAYRHHDGLLHQCIYCRSFQNPGVNSRWDWVPVWVRKPPPGTSHGVCNTCKQSYFASVGIDPRLIG